MATRRSGSLGAGLAALLALGALGAQGAAAAVYFSAFPGEGGTAIERAPFAGSPREVLTAEPAGFDEGIALDVPDGKMYWTDSIASVIFRANLNGSDAQVIYDDLGWEPLGIALDPGAGKIYWNDRQGIKRANLDGSDEELLIEGATNGLLALDLSARRMYWIAGTKIKSAAMEAPENKFEVSEVASGQSKAFGLAVDSEHGELYWLELERDEIRRMSLSGGEPETILTQEGAGFEGGLAVDPAAGRLYWTAAGSNAAPHDQVEVANLAGGEARTLFSTGEDIPEALAVEDSEPHPIDTLAPSLEGVAQVGSPLSCDPGAWSGIGPISVSYAWLVDGDALEGVSGPVYVPSGEQAGASVACVVSASDDVQTSSAQSVAVTIAGIAPAAPGGAAAAPRAKLIAAIALAQLTSSGASARIPVFTSMAGRATLSAQPIRPRRRRRGPAHGARARTPRSPKAVSARRQLSAGRGSITLRGLVRGTLYRLTLTVIASEGQLARSSATLRVARR